MTAADSAADGGAGKGLALAGLIIGLITGLGVYGIVEYWLDGQDDNPLGVTVLAFWVTLAAAWLLMIGANAWVKSLMGAVLIAAIFIVPDYFIFSSMMRGEDLLDPFPAFFWVGTRGLAAYIAVTLVKASLETKVPPNYSNVFLHGVTLPLIAGGAKLFALLALVLLFAWARLLKELDVNFFNKLFQEPWFILPFLGAIGGLSITLIRGLQSLLGALRFVLLLLARILMVITAVFTVTLLVVLAIKGVGVVFDRPYPSAWMMGLALFGMLIFNGVYQNGEGGPPPAWLRIPTLITLIGFPVYACIAFYAFSLRIDAYGLTPTRIAGIAVNGLVAAYSVVCIAGLVTEANWRAKRWMPLVGPLNTIMAGLWVAAIVLLASPLVNPWAMSANSQYHLLANSRIAAEDFDFSYLRFGLGKYGDQALDKLLALDDHPEAHLIQQKISEVRKANDQWELGVLSDPDDASANATGATEVMAPEVLPLNPGADEMEPAEEEATETP